MKAAKTSAGRLIPMHRAAKYRAFSATQRERGSREDKGRCRKVWYVSADQRRAGALWVTRPRSFSSDVLATDRLFPRRHYTVSDLLMVVTPGSLTRGSAYVSARSVYSASLFRSDHLPS